jgi:hypothetical protein
MTIKLDIRSNQLVPPLPDEIKDGQWLGVTVRSQGPGRKVLVSLFFLFFFFFFFWFLLDERVISSVCVCFYFERTRRKKWTNAGVVFVVQSRTILLNNLTKLFGGES